MSLRKILLIFAGAIFFFCAFNWLMPITDPVETNYALTAKEMLLSGDWMSPRIYGNFWYDKPVMIYWLLILSFKFFGICDFAARFPSALAGSVTVTFAAWFYYRIYASMRGSLIFASILSGAVMFWIFSKMVVTDAVLVAVLSIALACTYLHLIERDLKYLYIAYVMIGIGILDKGPMAIVLPAFIIMIYAIIQRDWKIIKRAFSIPGLIITLLIGLPWYWYMYDTHGYDFVNGFLGLNNFVRATVSEHPEDNHFYYYMYMIPATLLPWSFIAIKAFWTERSEDIYKYVLAWVLGFFLFFTLMATKYPTYCLPVIFPALMITARFIDKRYRNFSQTELFLLVFPCLLIWAGLNVAALIFSPDTGKIFAMISVVVLGGFFVIVHKSDSSLIIRSAIGVTLAFLLFGSIFVPAYMHQRSSKAMAAHLPKEPVLTACYGDYMTSAVYYSGQRIVQLGAEETGFWAGKYVMPHELPESFFERSKQLDSYVLIRKNDRVQDFLKAPYSNGYRLVYADKYYYLLKRNGIQGASSK
ncbi:MAG: glycosyltransferase family 39 protein [Negativicutes bacterium]|jgi:4-amino-4-deoxy-L-arabinose transferase-like glycosyltransferase